MTLLGIFWRRLRGMQRRVDRANLSLVAAGGAFFAMLSLFPGLAALIAILGLVSDPIIVDEQLTMLEEFIPEQAFLILDTQIRRLTYSSTGVLGWATVISIAAALWSARRGTDALIKALNTVYGVPQRGGIGTALMALGLTLALITVVTVALAAMVILPVILAFLPLGGWTQLAVDAARWTVSVLVVFGGIWLLYRFAPNRRGHRVRFLSLGALLAVGVWALATWGFSLYLQNFGSYNEIYGSIGAVIALLMFLYITIFTVLLGATLNAELASPARAPQDPLPDEAAEGGRGEVATTITAGSSGPGI